MRHSTKGRYATRIMVYLACHTAERPARKQEIAEAEGISADYVEQLLMKLKTAGLVRSHRGARGGFTLTSDPEKTTVLDVLNATEGPLHIAPCFSEECPRSVACATRGVWVDAVEAMERLFSGKTIASLAKQAEELQGAIANTYCI